MNIGRDLSKLTKIMTRSFDDDSRRFGGSPDGGGPPGYNTGEFIKKWGSKGKAFTIRYRGQLAGFIIVFPNPGKISFLGNIAIDPKFQNLGLGTAMIRFYEQMYNTCKHWRLETPVYAIRNHYFYEKNGFTRVGIQKDDGAGFDQIIFEKTRK